MAKILILDIETRPNLAWVWGIWQQNINLNMLIETSEMICWAAKWYGEKEIFFMSTFHDGKKKMVQGIRKKLDEADFVVHYNGHSFDIPHINRAILLANLTPPSPYTQVDLIDTARRKFKWQSNKLEEICKEARHW